jgi:uncharacterized protein
MNRLEPVHIRSIFSVPLLLILAACPGPEANQAPALSFDTATVRVETARDTFLVRVEIAEQDAQRALGLMERQHLADDQGMLFVYRTEQPATAGFWMYRTRIPLDIAFLDGDGQIVALLAMEPCESPDPRWCPSYDPGVPYRAALEVNQGWFSARGAGLGDRIVRMDS